MQLNNLMGKIIKIKDYIIDKEIKVNEGSEEDCITERYDDVEIRVKKSKSQKVNARDSALEPKRTIKK